MDVGGGSGGPVEWEGLVAGHDEEGCEVCDKVCDASGQTCW